MKKILIITFLLFFCLSCAYVPSGYLGHSTNTQVVLSESNYEIIASVRGQSEAVVILGLILSNHKLYEKAKSNLYRKLHNSVELKGKSYALINMTSDESFSFFPPIYAKKTVVVSADVIVFNEPK